MSLFSLAGRVSPAACVLLVAASCSCGSGTTAPPQNAAPPELQGSWVTVLVSTSEQVTLTLGETSYHITRGPNAASGNISVQGADIIFFNSNLCNGSGDYSWSLSGGSLSFNSGVDPCTGRKEVLGSQTYNRPK